jgi:hypothetical protein
MPLINVTDLVKGVTVGPVSANATITAAESDAFTTQVSQALQIEPNVATTVLAIICQRGGTSRKAQGNINAFVNNRNFELAQIRRIMSDNKLRFTLRQYARYNATRIASICNHWSIEGDLAKKISRNSKSPIAQNLTISEKIWLSNFQMDNQDCPEQLRELIVEHYNTLFPGNKT